jgi:hypothetical protein
VNIANFGHTLATAAPGPGLIGAGSAPGMAPASDDRSLSEPEPGEAID